MTESVKKRIDYFDIAKGIGIILVVLAHARGPFSHYIFNFHMPFFFLISGLLYNTNADIKTYIKKKVLSLYIPFVFWNLLALIIKSIYYKDSIPVVLWSATKYALTLDKDGAFFGATWFLGALFVVSIAYKIADTFLGKTVSDNRSVILLLLSVVAIIIAFNINIPFLLSRTVILGFFYALGALNRSYKGSFKAKTLYRAILSIALFIFFAATDKFNSANMALNTYRNPLLFLAGAIAMSYALLNLCILLDTAKNAVIRHINKMLMFLGRRSIDIVIWQFVFFKPIIILQMLQHNETVSLDSVIHCHPVYNSNDGWWIIYTLAGIVLPLLWCSLLRLNPAGKFLKKIHIV